MTSNKLGACSLAVFVLSVLRAAPLSSEEQRIVQAVDAQLTEAISFWEKSVRIDSATDNLPGVRRMGDFYRAEFDALGFSTRWIDMPAAMKRAGHLLAERSGTRGKRLLLIGHLDTVLPGGEFRRDGDRVTGSGVGDMKGGNLILVHALKALHAARALDGAQIVVALTGDEESVGRPMETARRDLIEVARRSDVALAFENAVRETVTVARRGYAAWQLEVQGAMGHSSGIFSAASGSGAVFEAARILHALHEELREDDGVTFNPALIVGGTDAAIDGTRGTASGKTNVIAQRVVINGDIRFISSEQLARLKAKMNAIIARHLPRTSAELRWVEETPAMQATPANYELLRRLDRVSQDLGFGPVQALDPKLRGYGDISFVAPILPCLDGLGARCEASHTPQERSDVSALPQLIKRTAVLIHRLTR